MHTNIIHMLATRQSHVMRRPGIFFFAKNFARSFHTNVHVNRNLLSDSTCYILRIRLHVSFTVKCHVS